MQQLEDEKPKTKVIAYLLYCVSTAIIGSLQFGHNTGVINAPEQKLRAFFNYVSMERYGEPFSPGATTMVWSFAVAIFSAGGMVGSFSVGTMVKKFGRQKSMLITNILAVLGDGLMGLSAVSRSYEMVIIGRLMFCGLCTSLTPMYVGEISPTAVREAFGTLHQLRVVIGILVTQIFDLESLLGSETLWPLLLARSHCPARHTAKHPAALLPREFPLPADHPEPGGGGKKSTGASVRDEGEGMKMAMEKKVTILELFHSPNYRQPIVIAIAIIIQLSQQLSGINAVFYYSTNILNTEPIYTTIGAGVVNTVFTVVSLFLVERAGRRTLHLIGLGGMAVCAVLVTIFLALVEKNTSLSDLAIVAVFGFVASFEMGPGPIPWFIVADGPYVFLILVALLIFSSSSPSCEFPRQRAELFTSLRDPRRSPPTRWCLRASLLAKGADSVC
uniref:Solute carrier family 2 member 3b n=1 Tax=Salarias fasciatus TaxID=181472 RepID=A0A672IAZ5_SALFA